MHAFRSVLPVLALCLVAQPGGAEPIIKKSYSYFSISGRTGADLERELARRGPELTETGVRHPGATRITLGGSVRYEDTGRRCRVKDAKVELETRLTLPRWKNRKGADRTTALVWDTLSSDIKRHEERHAEIARQWARTLERELEALRPQSGCDKMKVKVDAKTQAIIAKHAADQDRFDRVEAASFGRRMSRMLKYRAKKLGSGG